MTPSDDPPAPSCFLFYSETGCQDYLNWCPTVTGEAPLYVANLDAHEGPIPDNEASSVKLKGISAYTCLTVFADRAGSVGDNGWCRITALQDIDEADVDSFEKTYTTNELSVVYYEGPPPIGLNKHVSLIAVSFAGIDVAPPGLG
jgi:hypothetical protein